MWLGQIVVFQADYDKIEFKKFSYDVISVASSPLRHRNDVTKITSQNFYLLDPPPIKISGYASGLNYIYVAHS